MMRRYVYYWVCLAVMLITASCTDDYGVDRGNSIVDENGEITHTFTLELPLEMRGASTYSMSKEDEDDIDILDVLVFSVGGGKETFVYRTQASKVETQPSDSRLKNVTVKLKASDDNHRLVFLANVTTELDALGSITIGAEKDLLLARLLHESNASDQWGKNQKFFFPMWGESKSIPLNANNLETVQMLRAVVRVDVLVDIEEEKENEKKDEPVNDFQLVSARLYKPNIVGHIVPNPNHMGVGENNKIKVTLPTIPDSSVATEKSARYEATSEGIVQQIYTYESEKNTDHLEKTSLVIGGKFIPADYTGNADDLKTTYYRVDFIHKETNADIDLLRNHKYIFKITGVNGDGYDDEDDANKNKPFNLKVEVIEWDEGSINDIVFNDQYFLGVSESEIWMPKPAADSSIIVTTDFPDGWTRTWTADNDTNGNPWFDITSDNEYSGIRQKDFLTFKVTENNDGAQRTAKIHLRAGVLKHTITVYQTIEGEGPPPGVNWLEDVGDANCYILDPQGDGIRIPVGQANNDGVERIGDKDPLEVEVLWTDTEAAVGDPNCVLRYVGTSGQGTSGHLEVVANKDIIGNALVAVKVNGVIRWSWHIWVQTYRPEVTAKTYSGELDQTWMDRNLGALSGEPGDIKTMGLTYQFGRKDPFPGMSSFAHTTPTRIFDKNGIETFIEIADPSGSIDMLEESIKKPMTYYKGFSTTNDWYTNSSSGTGNTDFWYKGEGIATPYDPCPDGWTINAKIAVWWEKWNFGFVPNQSEYGGYSDKIGYWPTAGYRDDDGELQINQVGVTGYYWMGQPNGVDFGNAIEIDLRKIGNDAIETGKGKNKAWGLSVRCVMEED